MTEREDDPMPTFVLKARDNLALAAVGAYIVACSAAGLDDQTLEVAKAMREIEEWRHRNPSLCKLPDHKHVPAR